MLETRRRCGGSRRAGGDDTLWFASGCMAADGGRSARAARAKSARRLERPGEMEFNGIDPIGHEDEPRRLFRNRGRRRGVYLLPTFLTVANLLCGYYAILATLEGQVSDFDNAARAIGIAILFDSLDGRVARAMGTNSEFGKQFDW